MNTKILLLPITGVTTFFILLFTFTKFFGPIPFSVNSVSTTKSDTFSVSGTGKVVATPDTAIIVTGVSTSGITVKDAQNQLNISANKVSEAIKKLGIEAKDIESINYNISPNIDYRALKQKVTGYNASTNLQIKIRDIGKTNEVIDTAVENGANQIGEVKFEVGDKTRLDNLARVKAVSDARSKAENAAKIAGFKLGKIINYSEGTSDTPPFLPVKTLQAAEKASTEPTQIEPGSSEIILTVTISYEII